MILSIIDIDYLIGLLFKFVCDCTLLCFNKLLIYYLKLLFFKFIVEEFFYNEYVFIITIINYGLFFVNLKINYVFLFFFKIYFLLVYII